MSHAQTFEVTRETVPPLRPRPPLRSAAPADRHCGAVRFEAAVALDRPGSRCNCSVCTKTSVTSGMVAPKDFELLAGEESLRAYEWGAKTSKRFFCVHCGVHCFGRGFLEEIGGHYVAVNLNCIDGFDPAAAPVIYGTGATTTGRPARARRRGRCQRSQS